MKKIFKLKEVPQTINTGGYRASNTEKGKKKLKTYTNISQNKLSVLADMSRSALLEWWILKQGTVTG